MSQQANSNHVQLKKDHNGRYVLDTSETKGSAQSLRDKTNKENRELKSVATAQVERHQAYKQHSMSGMATKVVASLPKEDLVSFDIFVEQELADEKLVGRARASLNVKPEDKYWRPDLKKLLNNNALHKHDDLIFHIYKYLSPEQRNKFKKAQQGKNFDSFVDELSQDELLTATAVIVAREQNSQVVKQKVETENTQLTAGIKNFILSSPANKEKCQYRATEDLMAFVKTNRENAEFRALPADIQASFKKLIAINPDEGAVRKFVENLSLDVLVAMSVAHQKDAVLNHALMDIRTVQQTTFSPELGILGLNAAKFRQVFNKTFGPEGEIQRYLDSITGFNKFFSKNKKAFKAEAEKLWCDALDGQLEKLPTSSDVRVSLSEIQNDRFVKQKAEVSKFILKIREDLKVFVDQHKEECQGSVKDFLINTEFNERSRGDFIAFLTAIDPSFARRDELETILKSNQNRAAKITEFVQGLNPQDLRKLYVARLAHALSYVKTITPAEIKKSFELQVLTENQLKDFNKILEVLRKDQQKAVQDLIKGLNDNELKVEFKAHKFRELAAIKSVKDLKESSLVQDLEKYGAAKGKFKTIYSTHTQNVQSFIDHLSDEEMTLAYRANSQRVAKEKAQENSWFGFKHDCAGTVAEWMTCVSDVHEIPRHPIVASMSTVEEQQQLKDLWNTHILDRPALKDLPKTTTEFAPAYQEFNFCESNLVTGDQVFSISGRVNQLDPIHQGNNVTHKTAVLEEKIDLNKFGPYLARRTFDLIESQAKTAKVTDGATADMTIGWIETNGKNKQARFLNSSVGGNVQSVVAIVNKLTGAVRLTSVNNPNANHSVQSNIPEGSARGKEAAEILTKANENRSNSTKTGIHFLGYDNLKEQQGELVVLPTNSSDLSQGITGVRAIGHFAHKVEKEGSITVSPEALVHDADMMVDENEEVFLIQHQTTLSANQLGSAITSNWNKDSKSETVNTKALGADLLNIAHANSNGNVTVRVLPIKSKEPVCAILSQGRFGDATAKLIEEKGMDCLSQAMKEATEEKYLAEFQKLKTVQCDKSWSFDPVKLGCSLEDLWEHAEELEGKSNEAQQAGDLKLAHKYFKQALDARSYVHQTLAIFKQIELVEKNLQVNTANPIYTAAQLNQQLANLRQFRETSGLKEHLTKTDQVVNRLVQFLMPLRIIAGTVGLLAGNKVTALADKTAYRSRAGSLTHDIDLVLNNKIETVFANYERRMSKSSGSSRPGTPNGQGIRLEEQEVKQTTPSPTHA